MNAWTRLLFGVCLWGLGLFAQAATLEVLAADRLELRREAGAELVILIGSPVEMRLDDQVLRAERVEYSRAARRLVLMGSVFFQDEEGRVIQGEYLELHLEDETLEALKVEVQAGEFDLTGPVAQRVAGQILLQEGYFTPCGRCGQPVPDYAFTARKVVLYPGDRLIAYDAWVLSRDAPVLFLPVLMLHLSERRPRLEVGLDETDGLTVFADLPYVTAGGLGFTLLRYFERRGLGIGFDHFGAGEAFERYRFLYLPPEVGETKGLVSYDLEYRLEDKAFRQEARIVRDDAVQPGITTYTLEATRRERTDPFVRFTLDGVLDHDPSTPAPVRIQKLPELELAWRRGVQTRAFRLTGRLVFTGFQAPTNELNRSARALGREALVGRTLVEHAATLRPPAPWPGLGLSLENRFRGFYYSTAERQVDWTTRFSLRQAWGPFSLALTGSRAVQEGETPLRLDRLPERRSERLEGSLALRPVPEFSVSARLPRDLLEGTFDPLALSLTATPRPLSLRLDHTRDLEADRPLTTRAQLQFAPRPWSFRVTAGFNHPEARYDPMVATLAYALVGGNLFVSHRRDLNSGVGLDTSVSATLRREAFAFTLTERLDERRAVLVGRVQTVLGPQSLSFTHTAYFKDAQPEPEDALEGTADLSLAYTVGRQSVVLTARWLGDEARFIDPTLRLRLSRATLEQAWQAEAVWHLPEAEDQRVFLERFTARGGLDLWPDVSLQGGLAYQRTGEGRYTLSLDGFGVTVAFRAEPKTNLFVSGFVSQTFNHPEGVPPLAPKFVITLDRCCWGARLTLDAARREARLAFLFGGQAASFLFREEGIELPGGLTLPALEGR